MPSTDIQNAQDLVRALLQINAIKVSVQKPFTLASGLHSPVYCDNRLTLSFPAVRTGIRDLFVEALEKLYPEVEVVVGVATGAIAAGVLVAEQTKKPFAYVRSSAKGHGLQNAIEGKVEKGTKVVVIEDLISTGGSSLKAVEALREAGADVLGLLAIFSWKFESAVERFAASNCPLHTLADYDDLIAHIENQGSIDEAAKESLIQWQKNPQGWQQP